MNLVEMYKASEIKKMVSKGMPEQHAKEIMDKIDDATSEIYKQIKHLPWEEQLKFMKKLEEEFDNRAHENTNEFDKTTKDRIIIETTDKINEIAQWVKDNMEMLCPDGIIPVIFEQGIIELKETNIEIGFVHINNSKTQFFVFQNNRYMYKFETSSNKKPSDIVPVWASWMDKDYRKECAKVLKENKHIENFVSIFGSLMVYATYHKETVIVDEPKRKSSSGTHKQVTVNNILPLTPKRYVIKHIDKSIPGHHAAPDHQVEVRPTMRHYKNGKVVPVKGFVKYKDKPKKEHQPKIYKA